MSIRTKLLLLAGLPVLGALLLSALIALGARRQAQAAAALGSIEDVARLSQRIGAAIHALQTESARAALFEGTAARPEVVAPDQTVPQGAIRDGYAATDAALRGLNVFLDQHDTSHFPSRLARGVADAKGRLAQLAAFRIRTERGEVSLDEILAYYGATDEALVRATMALMQLSDDGELLRSIGSLVAMEQLTERAAREHALLSYVFASTQFPPGSFKSFVTQVTEERVYEEAFGSTAAEAEAQHFRIEESTPSAEAVRATRGQALETTDDVLHVDANQWFSDGEARLRGLHEVEDDIVAAISTAATAKVAAMRSSILASTALSLAVLLSSALMAWAITRGLTRAVGSLSRVAELVRTTKDYGVRAVRTTGDELGVLTDVFNEMLADIQGRDAELQDHRDNLETAVKARTAELSSRNEAMRLVLDNVDEGLATIRPDGTLDVERSVAFDRSFGAPVGTSLADALAKDDGNLGLRLQMAWEQIADGLLPLELAVAQFPSHLLHDGRQFMLRLKPIVADGVIGGALLISSDVTAEALARAQHETQREYVTIFERVMADQDGFAEFAAEIDRVLARLASGAASPAERTRLVHTVKGNAAQWGAASVAAIAHDLESQAALHGEPVAPEQIRALSQAWSAVGDRFRPLLGELQGRIAVTREEMAEILACVRARAPHEEIGRRLGGLLHERTQTRFERMVPDLARLAARAGKLAPTVVIESHGVRLPPARFASFWQATVHLLRNLVDHGIEPEAERVAGAKSPRATVTLRSVASGDRVRFEFGDDGRGIDWEAVAARARHLRLPHATHEDLERALFAPGVSTAAEVSELSGRGIGLSAFEDCCIALGGSVHVESTRGVGTRFIVELARSGGDDSLLPRRLGAGTPGRNEPTVEPRVGVAPG